MLKKTEDIKLLTADDFINENTPSVLQKKINELTERINKLNGFIDVMIDDVESNSGEQDVFSTGFSFRLKKRIDTWKDIDRS